MKSENDIIYEWGSYNPKYWGLWKWMSKSKANPVRIAKIDTQNRIIYFYDKYANTLYTCSLCKFPINTLFTILLDVMYEYGYINFLLYTNNGGNLVLDLEFKMSEGFVI